MGGNIYDINRWLEKVSWTVVLRRNLEEGEGQNILEVSDIPSENFIWLISPIIHHDVEIQNVYIISEYYQSDKYMIHGESI